MSTTQCVNMKLINFIILIFIVSTVWIFLHFLCLWLEKKGWLYYKNKPKNSGAGNAFQEMSSIMNPSAKKIIEFKLEEKTESKKTIDKIKN